MSTGKVNWQGFLQKYGQPEPRMCVAFNTSLFGSEERQKEESKTSRSEKAQVNPYTLLKTPNGRIVSTGNYEGNGVKKGWLIMFQPDTYTQKVEHKS